MFRKIRFEIHKTFISIRSKNECPEKGKESIIVPLYMKNNNTDCSKYRGISILPTMYKILSNILLSRLTPYAEEISGDNLWGFRRKVQLLIIYCAFVKYLQKVNIMEECQLFIRFKGSYGRVRREVL